MTSKQSQTKTLTDTQLVLLSAASQCEDRGLVRPETMDARLFTRAMKALLKAGLIAESAAVRKGPVRAGSDGATQMLVITVKADIVHAVSAAFLHALVFRSALRCARVARSLGHLM